MQVGEDSMTRQVAIGPKVTYSRFVAYPLEPCQFDLEYERRTRKFVEYNSTVLYMARRRIQVNAWVAVVCDKYIWVDDIY